MDKFMPARRWHSGSTSLSARIGAVMPSNLISVVIPCFNAKRYVAATLASVLAQTGVQLDIVVVDDGSTDGTADFVRKGFADVRVFEQSNQGVAVARNLGIAEAKSDWIAFIDADDIWLPGKLQAQLSALASSPAARMSYTAWHVWETEEPEPPKALIETLQRDPAAEGRWDGPTGWIYASLLLDCVVWTSSVLIHRSVLQEVGNFDPTLRVGEDYDLWLRASRVTPVVRVCKPLAMYRMHPASITKKTPDRNFKGEVIGRAIRRWGYGSPDGSSARPSDVNQSLARSWSDYGGAHLMAGNSKRARQAALKALTLAPSQMLGWKVLIKSVLMTPVSVVRPHG